MKLPEKFYVARQYRGSEEIVGYMVDATSESTKTFEKKKLAADKWAGKTLEPITVLNTPRSGFHIVTNVSRHSTSNVLWRILHPEGFEFEITSDNFCDLLQTNTIQNGEIMSELFFTSNKKLVNKNTKLFAKLLKEEAKAEKMKEAMSELAPGMAFRVNGRDSERGNNYVYLGRFHAICNGLNYTYQIPAKSSLMHVIKRLNDNVYFVRAKMSEDITFVDFLDIKEDRAKFVKETNEYFRNTFNTANQNYGNILFERVPLLVNDKPFKRTDMVVEYKKVQLSTFGTIQDHKIYKYSPNNGNHYRIFGFIRPGAYNSYTGRSKYIEYTMKSDTNEMFGRISTLQDSGELDLGMDMSTHVGFGRYSATFHDPCDSYPKYKDCDGLYHLTMFKEPTEFEEGYYKLQGE